MPEIDGGAERIGSARYAGQGLSSRNVLQVGYAACIVDPATFRVFTSG